VKLLLLGLRSDIVGARFSRTKVHLNVSLLCSSDTRND